MSEQEAKCDATNEPGVSTSVESFIERVLEAGHHALATGGNWEDGVRKELLQLSGPFRSGQLLTAVDLNYIHCKLDTMVWEIEQLKNTRTSSDQANEEILK